MRSLIISRKSLRLLTSSPTGILLHHLHHPLQLRVGVVKMRRAADVLPAFARADRAGQSSCRSSSAIPLTIIALTAPAVCREPHGKSRGNVCHGNGVDPQNISVMRAPFK